MHFLVSNMKKKNLKEAAVEAEDVVDAVVVEAHMIMGALRLKTVKELTSISTSLKSTTWYMKSIRSLYLRFTLIITIMKIPVVAEVEAVEEEVDVGVEVVTSMTRELQTPVLRLRLSKI